MTRCSLASCALFAPGHAMNVNHAKSLTQTPWEWRDARVTALAGEVVSATLVDTDIELELWHHRDLSRDLAVGDRVRVHERFHALGWPYGWVNALLLRVGQAALAGPPAAPPEQWTPPDDELASLEAAPLPRQPDASPH